MKSHFDLTDSEFVAQLERCELDPALFNHEAHIRLAWIFLKRGGIDHAVEQVPQLLLRYVESLGARDKYNHTLTVAAVRVVYHFTLRSTATDFQGFIQESPRLITQFKALLASHYGIDIFRTEKAKSEYLEPDLLPFD